MMKHTTVIILSILFFTLLSCETTNPVATIETELGNISIELYQDKAPVTVANFLLYIEKKMFNNGEFYRVVNIDNQPNNNIKIDVIQGGMGWDDNIPRLDSIAHETTKQTGIKHLNGTISMARNAPGSASSEFFICIGSQPELDFGGKRNPDGQGFAAFGKVIKGMNVATKIHQLPNNEQFLEPPVKIISVFIE